MSVINLRHGPRTENTAPILFSGADHIENTVSFIVACWNVFTEPLPGNASQCSLPVIQLGGRSSDSSHASSEAEQDAIYELSGI
jgi:hypothetical protein